MATPNAVLILTVILLMMQSAFSGPVVRVVDGDTIRVMLAGREEVVRYIGMAACSPTSGWIQRW